MKQIVFALNKTYKAAAFGYINELFVTKAVLPIRGKDRSKVYFNLFANGDFRLTYGGYHCEAIRGKEMIKLRDFRRCPVRSDFSGQTTLNSEED